MKFCEWLQARLDERKLRKSDLAKGIGSARSTVTLYLQGERYPEDKFEKAIVEFLSEGNIALKTKMILELWEIEK